MSLIIKGMQLPRKSERRACSIAVVENRPVSIAFSRTKTNPFECFECTEIPAPHGRLIDADKFLEWLQEFYPNHVAIMSGVKNAKTIIKAEGVNE